MRHGKRGALLIVVSTSLVAAIQDPIPVDAGLISGVPGSANGVRVYKGIPFAAPPVGNLRWRLPEPVTPWKGVHKADEFSNICTQISHEKGSYYQIEFYREPELSSEDCLYLNIWTPAQSPL